MSRGLLAQPARHAGFAGRVCSLAQRYIYGDIVLSISTSVLFAVLAASWHPGPSSLSDPLASNIYRVGEPIEIRFAYSGDIEDWDAQFHFNLEEIPPLIEMGASAVFVLSRGTGPFESRVVPGRSQYRTWELIEAPRGMVVEPKNKRFGGVAAYNVIINQPFDEVVDLTEYFELGEPGVYTLIWGCQPSHLQELVFEVRR